MTNIFLLASRAKLRFATEKNKNLTVEDLWSLDIPVLGEMADALESSLKPNRRVRTATKEEGNTKLAIEIIDAIIEVRTSEKEAAKTRATEQAVRQSQIENIDKLIAEKEIEEYKGKTLEELKQLRDNL